MQKCFSSNLLRRLRNEIPIDWVIISLLKMEVKNTHGILRFRCPLCFNFHTATKKETNLARCFDCKNNFNPIDLVMAVDDRSFIEAVEFLKNNASIK
jgi:hypothetical protein